jgi:3',5'-cyclic AMP phosphodiesterase CpdA
MASVGAPLAAFGAREPADFSFVVVNDIHYRDQRCGVWLGQVAEAIRGLRPRPAFVALAGDLAESGTREQLGAVREIFRALPVPVRVMIGNHDYTDDQRREPYLELFGPNLNYRFREGGCEFLALDTTQGREVFRTRVPRETVGWLDQTLPGVSRNRPLIVLTHFPLGRNWLRPLNAGAVMERLRPFAFQASFSGHWHGLTESTERRAHLSTGRCCSWWRANHDGSPLKGFALCSVRDGAVRHSFVAVKPEGSELVGEG